MKTASCILSPGTVLAAIFLCAGNLTHAAILTTQQSVKAQVNPTCTVTITSAMAFGNLPTTLTLAVTQTDSTSNGRALITCTNGSTYTFSTNGGNNYSTGPQMINDSGQYLKYEIHSTPARTAPVVAGTTTSGTGTGAGQNLSIFGRVPAQTAGGFGNFTDTLTFTVTY